MTDIKDIREEDLNKRYSDLVKVLGLETTLKLGQEFGGNHLYIQKLLDRKSLEAFAERDPLYMDIIKAIGIEATLKLGKEFGGEFFYLTKLNGSRGPLSRARERMIIAELKTFQGSIITLARKYRVTSRCVQYIIKREHAKMVKDA